MEPNAVFLDSFFKIPPLIVFYVKTLESSLVDMIKMWFAINRRRKGQKSIP